MTKKRRNPQDTTLRNVRAAKNREATVTRRINSLGKRVSVLEQTLAEVARRVKSADFRT